MTMNVNLGIKYSTSQIVTLRGPYFGEIFLKYNLKVLYRIALIILMGNTRFLKFNCHDV